MRNLHETTVVITDAFGGLGRAPALRFARARRRLQPHQRNALENVAAAARVALGTSRVLNFHLPP
jgi:hypothetical protein